MVQLRRLTDKGIERFQAFVDSICTDECELFDPEVVNDPVHSETLVEVESFPETCPFTTRYEVAEYLADLVKKAEMDDPALDRGFWCWLSWVWFESLCKPDSEGRRKPGAVSRWVLSLDYDRYYKHYLAGPWWVYEAHSDDPERAISLLCTNITSPGDLVETIAGRQEYVSNHGLVEAVSRLYYDPETRKHKRGHTTTRKNHEDKTKGRPGTARRFVEVVEQLDMIWDLYATTADEFLELMPQEFDRFKPATS